MARNKGRIDLLNQDARRGVFVKKREIAGASQVNVAVAALNDNEVSGRKGFFCRLDQGNAIVGGRGIDDKFGARLATVVIEDLSAD